MTEPVDLNLWQRAEDQGPVDLDLGAADLSIIYSVAIKARNKPSVSTVTATISYCADISSTSPKTEMLSDIHYVFHAAITTQTESKVTLDAQCSYDINVYRDPAGYGGHFWDKQAEHANNDLSVSDWRMGSRTPVNKPVEWQKAGRIDAKSAYLFSLIPKSQSQKTERYTEAVQSEFRPEWLYIDLPKTHKNRTEKYTEAIRCGHSASAPFWQLLPRNHRERAEQWQVPGWLDVSLQRQLIRKGRWIAKQSLALYEEAIWPFPGISDHTLPPITPPLNVGDVNLNFYREHQFNTDLEFWVDIGAARIIPIRRVYLVSNTASIIRVRDGLDIPSTSVSIDYDDDSWAWQCSFSVPLISIAEALDGEEVIISLNGYEWLMSIDGWSDNKAWNSQSATVTGRSRTKELSSSIILPSSYVETQDRTIIQLAEQELINDWTIDWQAADWLVPGGVWSYGNKVPIDNISELAAAAGAFVMPDRINRSMTVLPKYKTNPWDLGNVLADIQIPNSIMISRGRKREYGTNANGVWLTGGQKNTITAQVKRAGSAGDKLLSDTTNALISHVDGARALGSKLLAESLNRSIDSIELPISAVDTGLILPGMILSTADGKSYARSFKATAQKNSDHKLVIRQSIEIERPIIAG